MYRWFYEGNALTSFPLYAMFLFVGIFVGVLVWAYSGQRRRRFEEAARLPLEDDR